MMVKCYADRFDGIPIERQADGVESEHADVLAYLRRRLRAVETVLGNDAASAESLIQAGHFKRQLNVLIDEIAAGLHHGVAATERALAAAGSVA